MRTIRNFICDRLEEKMQLTSLIDWYCRILDFLTQASVYKNVYFIPKCQLLPPWYYFLTFRQGVNFGITFGKCAVVRSKDNIFDDLISAGGGARAVYYLDENLQLSQRHRDDNASGENKAAIPKVEAAMLRRPGVFSWFGEYNIDVTPYWNSWRSKVDNVDTLIDILCASVGLQRVKNTRIHILNDDYAIEIFY